MSTGKVIEAAAIALEVLAIIRAVTDAANTVIERAREENRDVTLDELERLRNARSAALLALGEKLG